MENEYNELFVLFRQWKLNLYVEIYNPVPTHSYISKHTYPCSIPVSMTIKVKLKSYLTNIKIIFENINVFYKQCEHE